MIRFETNLSTVQNRNNHAVVRKHNTEIKGAVEIRSSPDITFQFYSLLFLKPLSAQKKTHHSSVCSLESKGQLQAETQRTDKVCGPQLPLCTASAKSGIGFPLTGTEWEGSRPLRLLRMPGTVVFGDKGLVDWLVSV